MKILKILGALISVVVLLLAGAFFYLNHYVQSPEFKQALVSSARNALHTDVKINDVNFSLTSGVTLRGVAIANPPGFDGDLLTASLFVLRYQLGPLLNKRLEITQLSLDKPTITLARNEKGDWNYDALLPAKETATPTHAKSTEKSEPTASGVDIDLPLLAINKAEIVLLKENKSPLAKVQGVNITTSAHLIGGKLNGTGHTGIDTISAADMLFLRNIVSPLAITPDEVKLPTLTGKLARGDVVGDIALRTAGGFKYLLNFKTQNSDVDTLLQEAGKKRVISGRLQATLKIEGTGGLPTMTGHGQLEILDGVLIKMPAQDLIAALLQVPELRQLQFTKCILEFAIADNVMQTPVIKLTAPNVEISGKGSVALDDYTLDHVMTLAIHKNFLTKVPKEVLKMFRERSDGFYEMDFKVYGPYDKPKTDLTERIVKGAVGGLLDKFLK